ncbi:MAG TPA: mobile mystery protein B [Cyclobacteriaceae bacterium]|jgi:Fic-DOC domain mobile mystery protein B|nr:mobile mystery protein B [Cyclobacteriaceae bacterium]
MGLISSLNKGQTPLDEEEMKGLLIPTIATREELDEFEQQNIEQALHWILKRSFKIESVLTEEFIKNIHKRMYGDTWVWAGTFRKTNKNIGIDWWQIAPAFKSLTDDARFWIANKTYEADEIAIRFKHRLVSIRCFSNGNGRHSRIMADILVGKIFGQPVFTWGEMQRDPRTKYLAAVKAADQNDIAPLLSFARS